jgi:hypothetical protein
MIGGCEVQRETEKYLQAAGPWKDIDLSMKNGQPWYHLLPKTVGVLTR